MCLCVHWYKLTNADVGGRGESRVILLDLQKVVSGPFWMLGTKLGSLQGQYVLLSVELSLSSLIIRFLYKDSSTLTDRRKILESNKGVVLKPNSFLFLTFLFLSGVRDCAQDPMQCKNSFFVWLTSPFPASQAGAPVNTLFKSPAHLTS